VTQFDIIALIILGVSGLIGFVRGAMRELITVVAFVLAVLAALFALRFVGPFARHSIHPAWLANTAALIIVFVIAYIVVRMIGAGLSRRVHDVHALGGLDRLAGLGIGLIRGFVILGVFQLVFNAATPPERMPHWISHAALYPVATDSAQVLRALAPQGSAVAGRLAPTLQSAVTDSGSSDSRTDERQPVEKPR
jgi:membrane protein required for colicin V production